MKKKIKDLTIAQCIEICNNNNPCDHDCPLWELCSYDIAHISNEKRAEKEVEV